MRDPAVLRNQSVSNQVLVFDIGGHGIRSALADNRTGVLLRQVDLPEERREDADANGAFRALLQRATRALEVEHVQQVVIAAPGPVVGGCVTKLPTLYPHNTAVLNLVAIGRQLWPDAALWVANDITAAGYAFVAAGHRNFCIFTCGSGIGGKVFLDGAPLLGPAGMGGEFGHWRVPGAPALACDCGGSGHLGAMASGRGAVRLAQAMAERDLSRFRLSSLGASCHNPEQVDSHLLAEHFRAGDPWSVAVIDRAAQALGSTLALLHLATAIDRFFVTGGFGTALGADYGARIGLHAQAACWSTGIDWGGAVTVVEAGIEYGLIGAAQMTLLAAPEVEGGARCG